MYYDFEKQVDEIDPKFANVAAFTSEQLRVSKYEACSQLLGLLESSIFALEYPLLSDAKVTANVGQHLKAK
jgi:hypothetical protein